MQLQEAKDLKNVGHQIANLMLKLQANLLIGKAKCRFSELSPRAQEGFCEELQRRADSILGHGRVLVYLDDKKVRLDYSNFDADGLRHVRREGPPAGADSPFVGLNLCHDTFGFTMPGHRHGPTLGGPGFEVPNSPRGMNVLFEVTEE